MNDDSQTDFERRLQARISQHRADYADTHEQIFGYRPKPVESPPDLSQLSFEEALAVYESWTTQRMGISWPDFFAGRDQQRPEESWSSLNLERWAGQPAKQLRLVDHLVEHAFDLDLRLLPRLRRKRPLVYCSTLEEYTTPLVAALQWPRDEHAAALAHVEGGAGDLPLLSEVAYDLEGHGTFVNGWLLARQRGSEAQQALDGDRNFLAWVLGQIAAVRWGRGFLRSYTALGQEICKANMAWQPLRQALGLAVDEKARVVQRGFFLSRAGWSVWIGRFVEARARHLLQLEQKKGDPWGAAREIGGLIGEHILPNVPGVSLIQALANFVLQSTKTLGLAILFWNQGANRVYELYSGARFKPLPAGQQRLRNLAGTLLINDLEWRVGTYNLPYALLIAGNVRYGLPYTDEGVLRRRVGEMRENPDGRLVLLTMLDPNSAYDPMELAILADHKLQLQAPEEIRRPPS